MFPTTMQRILGVLAAGLLTLSLPRICPAPQVICRFECASYDGIPGMLEADFLVLLAHYGQILGADDPQGCLDSKVSRDHYVDIGDLFGWDAINAGGLDSCGSFGLTAAKANPATVVPAGGTSLPKNMFIVAGKPSIPGQQTDSLYPVNATGGSNEPALPPAGGSGSRTNGWLIKDNQAVVYQVHGLLGLVRLSDALVVVPPGSVASGANTVYIGITPLGNGEFVGLPLGDVVVRVTPDATYVYVVPVLVSVPAEGGTPPHSYKAAAKLRITSPGQYVVEQLYGTDPYHDPRNTTVPPEASPYNAYSPREIETDRSGSWVFVLSAYGLNDNDWLLIYDEAAGTQQQMLLTAFSPSLRSPIALAASSREDKLYLASAANVPSEGAELYRLTFNPAGPGVSLDGKVQIATTSQVTAICERPGDAALYVTGFSMPTFPEDHMFANEDPIFTTPRWAQVPGDANWMTSPAQSIVSQAMSDSDLALPLSAVFADAAADFDGDADVDLADFGVFQGCFNGPNRAPKGATCVRSDLDGDSDVDLADFGVFQSCFNGPNRTPACD